MIDQEAKQVTVTSESGVAWVGFWVGPDIYSHREFRDDLPQKVELSFEDIGNSLDGKTLSEVSTISPNGLSARMKVGQ